MKKFLFFIAAVFAVQTVIEAQTTVNFSINHLLGDNAFELNSPMQNNLSHDYTVSRLEYYISEIEFIDTDDESIFVEDTWLLVNANESLELNLGDFDISTIKHLEFHIGVDELHNHLDPATYPADHPLAPQSPSMHWGWASGYRFLALEGKGGPANNQLIELHGLGNDNYLRVRLNDVNLTAEDNQIDIELNADYSQILNDISVNAGVIEHGTDGNAKLALQNMAGDVFSLATTVATHELPLNNHITIFNNPSANGEIELLIDTQQGNYQIVITDVLGRPIVEKKAVDSQEKVTFAIAQKGTFFVQVLSNNTLVASRQIMMQ